MRNNENELEIINLAKSGNNKAFEKILKRYKTPVFFMIYQMVNNVTTAEDLTMESFEKAFKNIEKFTPDYKISTWIYKIAKNHTLDHIKSAKLKPKFVELDYMLQDSWTPEDQMVGQEQANIIENAIVHLNGNYREIMLMRLDGIKYKDIAKKLNVPIGTVQGYINLSKKKIITEQNTINGESRRISFLSKEARAKINGQRWREANKDKINAAAKKYREKKQKKV